MAALAATPDICQISPQWIRRNKVNNQIASKKGKMREIGFLIGRESKFHKK